MKNLALGQRVLMSGTVRKAHTADRTEYPDAGLPGSGLYGDDRTFSEGVIVGKRTVVTGKTIYDYTEGTRTFVHDQDSALTLWLVAFHLRRKPVLCRDDQVVAVGDLPEGS